MFPFIGKLVLPGETRSRPGTSSDSADDSWISAGINIATYGIPFWGISHVGIMAHATDGRLLIFESTSLDDLPCEISRRGTSGNAGPSAGRHSRVYKGKAWHYPLYRPLYPSEDERLTEFLMATIRVALRRDGGVSLGRRRLVLDRVVVSPVESAHDLLLRVGCRSLCRHWTARDRQRGPLESEPLVSESPVA